MRTYEDLIENMLKAEKAAPESISYWLERACKKMGHEQLLEVVQVACIRAHKDNGARTVFPHALAEILDRINIRLNELENEKYTAKYGGDQ